MIKAKKLVVFLLLGIIFFSSNTISTFASTDSTRNVTVISEYDMYKDINKTSKSDLLKSGLSEFEISQYKSTDYISELYKRSTLPEDDLIKLGYDDEQIVILKNFSGTETEIYALSASLTLSLSYSRSSISSSSTWCDVQVDWSWSQCPFFTQQDIIALAWTNGMYCDTSNYVNMVYYFWHDKSTQGYVSGDYGSLNVVLDTGVYTQKDIVPFNPSSNSYLKRGVMNIRVQKQAKVNELSFLAKYGHNQLGITPSVEMSASGAALGISFSWYLNEVGVDDLYVNLNK